MRMVYIGLGANLPSPAGSPEGTLVAATGDLARLGHIASRSSLYSTDPVGYTQQPRFINAVVALETDLPPHKLLEELMAIEQKFGRDRSAGIANGPRTLDLDILLFDQLIIREPSLEIPHPRLAERAFVLIPLCEIAPEVVDPSRGRTVSQLVFRRFPDSESKSHAVSKLHNDNWRAGTDLGDVGSNQS